MAKSKAQTHQSSGYFCHIPDLVQAFSYVEDGSLNLALKLDKPCMTVASLRWDHMTFYLNLVFITVYVMYIYDVICLYIR